MTKRRMTKSPITLTFSNGTCRFSLYFFVKNMFVISCFVLNVSVLFLSFLKKFPLIAKGPGPGPGPAGLTGGPGPGLGPAFTHSSTRLLGFHQMTRVS